MKLSTKIILPIILISALLILLAGCFGIPDSSPGYTPGTITGIIAAPCCSTSSTVVSEDITPSDWCLQCEQKWFLQKNIKVILTYEGEEIGSTTTNTLGEYTFANLSAGENYVITAICPDDGGYPLVKDVVKEVIEGEDYDAGITDCESTALGLIVDALVNLGISSEYIILEDIQSSTQFKSFVEAVCEVLENCGDITSDENLLDQGNSVLMEILGDNPGWTGGDVICVWNPTCPSPTADAGGPYIKTLVCPGDKPGDEVTVSFNGSASGAGGPLTYDWDFGDGGSSTLLNPTHTYASPTAAFYTVTFTVTGDDEDTCGSKTDATIVTITESDPLEVDAGGPYEVDACPCPGEGATVNFNSTASGTGTLTYAWDFGDGDTSSEADPSHTYECTFESPYTVTLTVTDDCGEVELETTVTVTECINTAPKINCIPTQYVCLNSTFTYTVTVKSASIDPGETLTYRLLHAPPSMTINAGTGKITWVAANCDEQSADRGDKSCDECICYRDVIVEVEDDGCCGPLSDTEEFTICVEECGCWCCWY